MAAGLPASSVQARLVTGGEESTMQVWPQRPPLEKVVQQRIVCGLEQLGFFVTSFSQARASNQTAGIPPW